MTSSPDSDLYPDVIAAGSLASALQQSATALGVDLGIDVIEQPSLLQAEVASVVANRGPARILLAANKRLFLIRGHLHEIVILSGSTPDLRLLVKAAEGWRAGASLREIERAAPILYISDLAESTERGPAEAVEARWRLEREFLGGSPAGFEELFNAAYAEPKLRQLWPFTSHRSFHFSRSTGYPGFRDVPYIDPIGDGRYRVTAPDGTLIGESGHPEDLVAMVVRNLPAGCGPATAERTA